MSKRFLIFFGIGLLLVAGGVFAILTSNKGSHLVLEGKILKIRSGALNEQNSIAVLDFRVENPSNLPFVVRDVQATLEKKDGAMVEGVTIAKSDLKRLFQYNRFLGEQYNDGLTIKDEVPPHMTVDRMVAVRFEVGRLDLESAKAIHLRIEEADGPVFEASENIK
jgi:hypothetical protein